MVIWIYGPEESGKTSIARTVAKRLQRCMVMDAPAVCQKRLRSTALVALRQSPDVVPIIVSEDPPRAEHRKAIPDLIVACSKGRPKRSSDLSLADLGQCRAANAVVYAVGEYQ